MRAMTSRRTIAAFTGQRDKQRTANPVGIGENLDLYTFALVRCLRHWVTFIAALDLASADRSTGRRQSSSETPIV